MPYLKVKQKINISGRQDSSVFGAQARIFVLIDGKPPFTSRNLLWGQKKLYQILSYTDVNADIQVEGGPGTASVVFNDKNFRFFRYMPLKFAQSQFFGGDPEFDELRKNEEEIQILEQILETYGQGKSDYLKEIGKFVKGKGILVPVIGPQNLIWIHMLGRDGYWYSEFAGIISSIQWDDSAPKTPQFRINCKTPDRLAEISFAVTGVNNLSRLQNVGIEQANNQTEELALTNKYGGKRASEILKDLVNIINDFFLLFPQEKDTKTNTKADSRYFKVDKIFGFGNPLDLTKDKSGNPLPNSGRNVIGEGESGYDIDSFDTYSNKTYGNRKKGRFELMKWHWDEGLNSEDLYPGEEVIPSPVRDMKGSRNWLQVCFSKDYHNETMPFQELIRNSLPLFNIDKMTPRDIMNIISKTTFSYIYCDGDGTLKMERPYFDTFIKPSSVNVTVGTTGSKIAIAPIDYDTRYIISKQDISYISSSFVEDESAYITRTVLQQKLNKVNTDQNILTILQGQSEASRRTSAKYGFRETVLNPIIREGRYINPQVGSAFALAAKTMINAGAKRFQITLDQRPDIQVNRNMVFIDMGICFLIKKKSMRYRVGGPATYTFTGSYVRYVGERLFNPWISLIEGGKEIKNWQVTPSQESQTDGFEVQRGRDTKKVIFDIYNPTYASFKSAYNLFLSQSIIRSKDLEGKALTFNETKNVVNFAVCRMFATTGTSIDESLNDYIFYAYIDDEGNEIVDKIPCGAEPDQQSVQQNPQSEVRRVKQGIFTFQELTKDEGDYLSSKEFYYQVASPDDKDPWKDSNTSIYSRTVNTQGAGGEPSSADSEIDPNNDNYVEHYIRTVDLTPNQQSVLKNLYQTWDPYHTNVVPGGIDYDFFKILVDMINEAAAQGVEYGIRFFYTYYEVYRAATNKTTGVEIKIGTKFPDHTFRNSDIPMIFHTHPTGNGPSPGDMESSTFGKGFVLPQIFATGGRFVTLYGDKLVNGVYNLNGYLAAYSYNDNVNNPDDPNSRFRDVEVSTRPGAGGNSQTRTYRELKNSELTIAPVYFDKPLDQAKGLDDGNIVITEGWSGKYYNIFKNLLDTNKRGINWDKSSTINFNIPIIDKSFIEEELPETYYPLSGTDDKSLFKRCLSFLITQLNNTDFFLGGNGPSVRKPLSVFDIDKLPTSLDVKEYGFNSTIDNGITKDMDRLFGAWGFNTKVLEDFGAGSLTAEDILRDQSRQDQIMDNILSEIKNHLMSSDILFGNWKISDEINSILFDSIDPSTGNTVRVSGLKGMSFEGEKLGEGSLVALCFMSYIICNRVPNLTVKTSNGSLTNVSPYMYFLFKYYQTGFSQKKRVTYNTTLRNTWFNQIINLFSFFGNGDLSFITSL